MTNPSPEALAVITAESEKHGGYRIIPEAIEVIKGMEPGPAAGSPLAQMLAKNPRDRQVGGDHYHGLAVQFWDVVDTWPVEQQIGYHRGAITQYLMRLGRKESTNRLQEAEKIAHCAEKLVAVLKSAEEIKNAS